MRCSTYIEVNYEGVNYIVDVYRDDDLKISFGKRPPRILRMSDYTTRNNNKRRRRLPVHKFSKPDLYGSVLEFAKAEVEERNLFRWLSNNA